MKRVVFIRNIAVLMILIGVVFDSLVGNAEEGDSKHPIDIWLDKCIETNSSTFGMNDCIGKAIDMWDKEMNRVYKELISLLPENMKEELKKSQRAWLKFRDDEFRFIENLYSSFQGSMWGNVLMGRKLRIVKERTLILQDYLQNFKDEY